MTTSAPGEIASARGEPQAADAGLFGPDSVTWRVHADPSMALGGLRALLLQSLHPLAMAGVAQHSDYRADPWGRLRRTAEYVAAVTYGTTADAEHAAERVRAIHARVRGIEPESGQAYAADDPNLLRWVHCAEVDSFLAAYRRCGGRLSRVDADAYVAEQVRAVTLLGVDPAEVPDSTAALEDYLTGMRGQLRATAAARDGVRVLLAAPMPMVARPAWIGLAATAFGLLPAWARRMFGPVGLLSAHPGAGLAAALTGRSLVGAVRLLPSAVWESRARRAALARLQTG